MNIRHYTELPVPGTHVVCRVIPPKEGQGMYTATAWTLLTLWHEVKVVHRLTRPDGTKDIYRGLHSLSIAYVGEWKDSHIYEGDQTILVERRIYTPRGLLYETVDKDPRIPFDELVRPKDWH